MLVLKKYNTNKEKESVKGRETPSSNQARPQRKVSSREIIAA